jgi:XTP/dITP diphosphohydrolase
MKIILASANKGKIREIKEYCSYEVLPYSDVVEPFDIIEDGDTFQENALIKARAIYEKLKNTEESFVILSDDSGISVPALGNEPGIYSARYAGEGVTDKDNLQKLIDELKKNNIKKTPAFYTAAMAIVTDKGEEFTVHGWMHGDVIADARGDKGFGYDPMFIPEGYHDTLGELESDVKKNLSHRSKALKLTQKILKSLKKT